MKKLYLKTVSRNMLEEKEEIFKSISFFNFENGTQKINLDKTSGNTILTQGTTWIRVYIKSGGSYDFITGSVSLFNIGDSVIVMCNDDAEFIDNDYIVKLVKEFNIDFKKNFDIDEMLSTFYDDIKSQTLKITEKMKKLYEVSNQLSSSRLDIQDSYDYGKQQLERVNILNILIRQVTTENKEEILSLLDK